MISTGVSVAGRVRRFGSNNNVLLSTQIFKLTLPEFICITKTSLVVKYKPDLTTHNS